VYAGFVREGVPSDDGFVGLHVLACELCEELACGENLLGPDARGKRQPIRSNSHAHDDLFERRVAGALADAVDGALT
jgi:hypothetical protein